MSENEKIEKLKYHPPKPIHYKTALKKNEEMDTKLENIEEADDFSADIKEKNYITAFPKERKPIPPMKPLNIAPLAEPVTSLCTFRASPVHLSFIDYVPGKTYIKHVQFTNVSSFLNQFKVTSVAIQISQMVKINHQQFTKVGMGACCNVEIVFSPPLDFSMEVHDAEVQFQTSMGEKINIFISLLKPKCYPIIASVGGDHGNPVIFNNFRGKYPNVNRLVGKSLRPIENIAKLDKCNLSIDFGICILGTKKTMWIDVANDGFLKIDYRISRTTNEFGTSDDSIFQIQNNLGTLNGYETKRIHIVLCPTYTADWRPSKDDNTNSYTRKGKRVACSLKIDFSDDKIYPIMVLCEGIALDPPLFADRSLMDFCKCLVDTIYHDQLFIHNLNNSALRFWLDFSPFKMTTTDGGFLVNLPSIGSLELSTSFGFVQPSQALPVWFTLKLSPESYDAHEQGLKPFKVPFTVNYVESQTKSQRSVPVLLTGTIADHKVVIKSSPIDFEQTSLLETKQHEIIIANLSQFPQLVHISSSDASLSLIYNSEHRSDYMLLKPLEQVFFLK